MILKDFYIRCFFLHTLIFNDLFQDKGIPLEVVGLVWQKMMPNGMLNNYSSDSIKILIIYNCNIDNILLKHI